MSFMWQAWDIEAHLIHPDKYKSVDTLRVYARVGPKIFPKRSQKIQNKSLLLAPT